MRVIVTGGDGYLGWPQAMYLSKRGYNVCVVDNFNRRLWDLECGTDSLIPIFSLQERVAAWRELTGNTIETAIGDLTDHNFISTVVRDFKPDAIVHYGEQRSAPFTVSRPTRRCSTSASRPSSTTTVSGALCSTVFVSRRRSDIR